MKYIRSFYFWIIAGLLGGSILGIIFPKDALYLAPLATNFIRFIKIFIGPIVFLTVATGIARSGSFKKLGKISIKTFIYFEVVSTSALLLGWAAATLMKPGALIHANLNALNKEPILPLLAQAHESSSINVLHSVVPHNLFEPFIQGDIIQVLFIAILCGIALLLVGYKRTQALIAIMERATQVLFQIIRIAMYAAPLAVLGAMAYAVGKFGGHLLVPLLGLVGIFYLTGAIFVFMVLGTITKLFGFSIVGFLNYILPEIFLVLGTASSEALLPQLMRKLESLGCERETVGVVVPLGYSFNLDGTSLYITLAALFIAQAFGIHLSVVQQLTLFVTAMLTSKGAAGVTGTGFIMLAATLSIVPTVPAVGIVLILGVDRFMSEARATLNFIGNGVAALCISCWEREVTGNQLRNAFQTATAADKALPGESAYPQPSR